MTEANTRQLVTGRSAYGSLLLRSRLVLAVYGLVVILVVVAILGAAFGLSRAYLLIAFVAFVVATFAGRVWLLLPLPSEKAEVAAGYTTLGRKHIDLDQLDPRTGAVVRMAGQPFLTRDELRSLRSGTTIGTPQSVQERAVAAGPAPDRPQRPSAWRRINPIWISAVLAIVMCGAIGLAFPVGRFEPTFFAIVFLVLVLVYAIPFTLNAIWGTRTGRAIRELSAQDATAVAFLFGSSTGFFNALGHLPTLHQRASIPANAVDYAWGATAASDGLSLWTRNPLARELTLPWSMVSAVSLGAATGFGISRQRGRSRLAMMVAVTTPTGPVQLELAGPYRAGGYNYRPLSDVRWLNETLNWYRARATAAA